MARSYWRSRSGQCRTGANWRSFNTFGKSNRRWTPIHAEMQVVTDSYDDVMLQNSAVDELTEEQRRVYAVLCARLRSPTPRTRLQAVEALGSFGSPALMPLALGLNDVEPEIRIAATQEVGKVGTENAISLLTATLYDEDVKVRIRAAEVLGNLNDDRVLGPLVTAYEHCFLGKSAKVERKFAPLEIPLVIISMSVLAWSLFGAGPAAILFVGYFVVFGILGRAERRRSKNQFCRALIEALVRVAERQPGPEFHRFAGEFRAVAANPLHYGRSEREAALAAAERIEALTDASSTLPRPATAQAADPGPLPIPAALTSDGHSPAVIHPGRLR